jgi:two-component system, chemotaxis family, protein-glutamate methylesterase/glutaminase
VHTLPRLDRAESVAALACPDCAGTLTVRVEGAAGHLRFKCRIGHAYALGSLLEAKEEAIEQRLWSALVSMEELASLLEELQALGEPYTTGEAWTAATDRVTRLRASVLTVRAVIERNVPIDLGPDADLEQDTEPSC